MSGGSRGCVGYRPQDRCLLLWVASTLDQLQLQLQLKDQGDEEGTVLACWLPDFIQFRDRLSDAENLTDDQRHRSRRLYIRAAVQLLCAACTPLHATPVDDPDALPLFMVYTDLLESIGSHWLENTDLQSDLQSQEPLRAVQDWRVLCIIVIHRFYRESMPSSKQQRSPRIHDLVQIFHLLDDRLDQALAMLTAAMNCINDENDCDHDSNSNSSWLWLHSVDLLLAIATVLKSHLSAQDSNRDLFFDSDRYTRLYLRLLALIERDHMLLLQQQQQQRQQKQTVDENLRMQVRTLSNQLLSVLLDMDNRLSRSASDAWVLSTSSQLLISPVASQQQLGLTILHKTITAQIRAELKVSEAIEKSKIVLTTATTTVAVTSSQNAKGRRQAAVRVEPKSAAGKPPTLTTNSNSSGGGATAVGGKQASQPAIKSLVAVKKSASEVSLTGAHSNANSGAGSSGVGNHGGGLTGVTGVTKKAAAAAAASRSIKQLLPTSLLSRSSSQLLQLTATVEKKSKPAVSSSLSSTSWSVEVFKNGTIGNICHLLLHDVERIRLGAAQVIEALVSPFDDLSAQVRRSSSVATASKSSINSKTDRLFKTATATTVVEEAAGIWASFIEQGLWMMFEAISHGFKLVDETCSVFPPELYIRQLAKKVLLIAVATLERSELMRQRLTGALMHSGYLQQRLRLNVFTALVRIGQHCSDSDSGNSDSTAMVAQLWNSAMHGGSGSSHGLEPAATPTGAAAAVGSGFSSQLQAQSVSKSPRLHPLTRFHSQRNACQQMLMVLLQQDRNGLIGFLTVAQNLILLQQEDQTIEDIDNSCSSAQEINEAERDTRQSDLPLSLDSASEDASVWIQETEKIVKMVCPRLPLIAAHSSKLASIAASTVSAEGDYKMAYSVVPSFVLIVSDSLVMTLQNSEDPDESTVLQGSYRLWQEIFSQITHDYLLVTSVAGMTDDDLVGAFQLAVAYDLVALSVTYVSVQRDRLSIGNAAMILCAATDGFESVPVESKFAAVLRANCLRLGAYCLGFIASHLDELAESSSQTDKRKIGEIFRLVTLLIDLAFFRLADSKAAPLSAPSATDTGTSKIKMSSS